MAQKFLFYLWGNFSEINLQGCTISKCWERLHILLLPMMLHHKGQWFLFYRIVLRTKWVEAIQPLELHLLLLLLFSYLCNINTSLLLSLPPCVSTFHSVWSFNFPSTLSLLLAFCPSSASFMSLSVDICFFLVLVLEPCSNITLSLAPCFFPVVPHFYLGVGLRGACSFSSKHFLPNTGWEQERILS